MFEMEKSPLIIMAKIGWLTTTRVAEFRWNLRSGAVPCYLLKVKDTITILAFPDFPVYMQLCC